MRKLSTITTPIIRDVRPLSYPRRSVRAVYDSLVCLALFKHDETETQIYVSHNDDPLCAVWIRKQPLLIDPRFSGRFVVITITKQLAQEKGLPQLGGGIFDFDKYLPEERAQLRAALEAAYRARTRQRAAAGYTQSSMGSAGRNSYA